MNGGLTRLRLIFALLLGTAVLAAGAIGGCGGSTGASADGSAAQEASAAGGTAAGVAPTATGTARQSPDAEPSRSAAAKATPTARAASGSTTSGDAAGGSPVLKVVFVDVGQGDATVLRSGAWTGLVDGGPAGSERAVAAALDRLGVRRLDTLVISHLHADHTGGLPSLIAEYRPRQVWVAGAFEGGIAAALHGAGTSVVQGRSGFARRLGGVAASVLSPRGLSGDANTDSIVLLLEAGGRRLLFTGDTTGPGEMAAGAALARGPPLDVLKVSHHGSRYSTTAGFVAAARPRTAVISVGDNSYGHPSDDVVQRLRRGGARVFTTQKSGAITLTVTRGGVLRWHFARSGVPITRGISRGSSSSSGGVSGGTAATAAGAAAGSAGGGATVYVTNTGECYHRRDCRYLSSSRIPTTLSRAEADGYRPCSVCDPPR
jgi:competence protein ComEC